MTATPAVSYVELEALHDVLEAARCYWYGKRASHARAAETLRVANRLHWRLRNWTVSDSMHSKQALWKLDAGYAKALDKFDSGVFRSRFPELFRDSTRSAPFEKTASEVINKLSAELTKSGPLTPDQEEILQSPGQLRDLLEIPSGAMEIVGAYPKLLAEDPRLLKPLSALPYPKTRIEEALKVALRNARDPGIRWSLETGLDALKDFIPDKDVPADPGENARAWFAHRAGQRP